LILIASPWATTWWQRNYFADALPWLRVLMMTAGMHALAIAVGVVTMAVGVADLWQVLSTRFSPRPPDVSAP
jgi:hypothetical protein